MAIIPTNKYSSLPVDELPLLDLLAAMAHAIRESDDLAAWCLAGYGQQVTVFSGSDQDNPPEQANYPLIELFPGEDNSGREIERYERTIGMVCGLYDDEKEFVVYNGLNIQRGVLRLEEMFRLALAAVAGSELSGGYIAEARATRDPDALFPYFMIGAEIRVVKPL